ncbi:MAG TPA: SIMPL domain-containing protein [Chloroflexia bacterium]|nr:SIMPL domain-containing protein [Chloroflexia bacterium]
MNTERNRYVKALGAMVGAVLLLVAFFALWLFPQAGSARVQEEVSRPAYSLTSSTNYAVSAAPLSEQPYISVRGMGIVSARPDMLTVQIGVVVDNSLLADAQWDANTRIDAAMKLLIAGGVADRDISTARLAVEPVYTYKNNEPPRLAYYRVTNILNVKLRDIAKAGKLIDSVVTAGVNRIQGMSFSFSDPTASLKAARDAAMADAKQKAQQLATQGGVGLGLPIIVQDAGANVAPKSVSNSPLMDSGSSLPPTQVSPGEQEVRVEVSVVYAIK